MTDSAAIKYEKQLLRTEIKSLRNSISKEEKERRDAAIYQNLQKLFDKIAENTVFTYVSGNIEVDTFRIIHYSLKAGKRVAVPRCVNRTGEMKFYYFDSMNQLEEGHFGIFEPRPEYCEEVLDYSRGICLVPGLSFDLQGFRLGYGKGYYDRFLSVFHGVSVGLCYEDCLKPALPVDLFDKKTEVLVTERKIYMCKENSDN